MLNILLVGVLDIDIVIVVTRTVLSISFIINMIEVFVCLFLVCAETANPVLITLA